MFVIPLTNAPNQNFRCTIPINGKSIPLDFTCRYNTEALYWSLSISHGVSGERLVTNMPLISSEYPSANLLQQWEHLRIGSAVIVKVNPDNQDFAPNGDNLGVDFVLVWGDNL